jgi:hypothetical protein
MTRTLIRTQTLAIALAVLVGCLGLPVRGIAGETSKDNAAAPSIKIGHARPVSAIRQNSDVFAMEGKRGTARGLNEIELNVDGWTGENLRGVGFTTFKASWGNRFTVDPGQTPFALTHVATALLAAEGGGGFAVDDPISIAILVDASGSGDPGAAVPVGLYSAAVVAVDALSAYQLPTPIVVAQGDIYVMFGDEREEEDGTVIFWFDSQQGAINNHRSFFTSANDIANGSSYRLWDTLGTDPPPDGNFIVRAFGNVAEPGTDITGGGEPVDESLPAPTDLTALAGRVGAALSWTAPNLPPPPTPTEIAEAEPNDSPATAQTIAVNTRVSGADKSGNGGAPGGFGTDDIEDWYAFTLTSSTSVTIDLTNFGGTDFDLLLYNAAGPFDSDEAVGTSGGAAGEEEHIEIAVLPAGTYVIAVTAFDPDVPGNTNYKLTLVAALSVNRYNIYMGSSDDFTPSADNFLGTGPGDVTNFQVLDAPVGSFFRVAAVVGASQTPPSNSAAGVPCEGGPPIDLTKSKIKLADDGKVVLVGGPFVDGTIVTVNGVGFINPGKVKKNGTKFVVKGPVTGNQPLVTVAPDNVPATVVVNTPTGGCATFELTP